MQDFRKLVSDTSFGAWVLFGGTLVAMVLGAGVFVAGLGFYWGIIAYEVVIILGAALIWHRELGEAAAPWPDLRRSGLTAGSFVLIVLASVVLGLWSNAVIAFLVDTFPGTFGESAQMYQKRIKQLLLEPTGLDWALAVAGVTIFAPVCEEALFRGSILPELRKMESLAGAIALNGVMFGLFHLNPLNALPLSVIGAYLAHVAVRSESLWPPILAHFALNAFNGVVMPMVIGGTAASEATGAEATPVSRILAGQGASVAEYAVAMGGLGALGALLWWGSVRLLKRRED